MVSIRGSVGRNGINHDGDVKTVQGLLNRHIVSPARLLKVDGYVGPKTINAILAFQRGIGIMNCDGRVDPGRRTFQALRTFPKSAPVTSTHSTSLGEISRKVGNWAIGTIGSVLDQFKRKTVDPRDSKKGAPPPVSRPVGSSCIAWGAKVSPEFKQRVIEICKELGINPDYLMSCMAFETGETFKANQPNNAGGKAIGLVQFTPIAIRDLNQRYNLQLTRQKLASMSDVEQLIYVRLYFLRYKGKLNSLEDIYMVIIAPIAVGRGPDGTVYDKNDKKHPDYYEKNKGLDKEPHDGVISLRECSVVLNKAYKKGLSKGYFG